MKVYELAKAVEPYVIEMRRYFHEHPELSNHEDKTIERLCEELDKMGISYEVVPHGGIIGYIEGRKARQDSAAACRLRRAAGSGAGEQPGPEAGMLQPEPRCNARLRP